MMSTDFETPGAVVDGLADSWLVSAALSGAEKTTAVTRVRYLERELLDDSGHIRRGVTVARADEIVGLLNDLRRALGWLEVDLDGRWRWPAGAGQQSTSRQQVA